MRSVAYRIGVVVAACALPLCAPVATADPAVTLPAMTSGGVRSATLLDPIGPEVAAFNDGRIQSYFDVIERSNVK